MDHLRPPPRVKSPEELARELQERQIQNAIKERKWRIRRWQYAVVTVSTGMIFPSLGLLLAGAISADSLTNWLHRVGWLPLLLTCVGGAAGAALVFLRGWGVSLGMITFGTLFMILVLITRSVLGSMLPAMPGLVALFVAAGGLVGYLTVLEEGE